MTDGLVLFVAIGLVLAVIGLAAQAWGVDSRDDANGRLGGRIGSR